MDSRGWKTVERKAVEMDVRTDKKRVESTAFETADTKVEKMVETTVGISAVWMAAWMVVMSAPHICTNQRPSMYPQHTACIHN